MLTTAKLLRRGCRIGVVATLLMLCSMWAQAHTGGSTTLADIRVAEQKVLFRLTLPVAGLPPALQTKGAAPGTEGALVTTLGAAILVRSGGELCGLAPAGSSEKRNPAGTVTLVLGYECAGPIAQLTVRDNLFEILGQDHLCLAKVEWATGTQQFAFAADNRELRLSVRKEDGAGSGALSFLPLGIEHILTGWDHLLFLLALLLRGGNLWSVFKIVTAFTLAHSVTLGLAALNVVAVPDRLVEAAIAGSIAYVAAENLFMRGSLSRRWLVSFTFGLVHGFGFSSALRELDLTRSGLLLSLLNFNLGVECGQALVVAAVIPLLLWLRRTRWEAKVVRGLSVFTLIVGLILLVWRGLF